jgi:GT2 family glycosyltransferase
VSAHPVAHELTVVIPTIGRPQARGCLESIADGDTWPAEVVVVDQRCSTELAVTIARLRERGLSAEHVCSSDIGIAAGTNRGLERATTAYIAVTHDDCRVAADWVRQMAERLLGVGEALLTGRVEPRGEGANPTVVTSMTPRVYRTPLLDKAVLFPANMGFPRSVINRIGPLDEHPSLRYAGEDNEWAYRALRRGVPIVYDPMLLVHHVAWRPSADLASVLTRYARGQGAFYGKYLLRGDRSIARKALRDLARAPYLVLRGCVTRNPSLMAMGRGEMCGLLPGIIAGMRGRPLTKS